MWQGSITQHRVVRQLEGSQAGGPLWQQLQSEWRMDAAAKVAKHADADRKKAESRAKREEEKRVAALARAEEEKRLEAWRANVAFNKARRAEKQAKSAQNRALKGHGPVIDKSTLSKDKMQFNFIGGNKFNLKPGPQQVGEKRKRVARCHKCGASHEVDGPVYPGWTCPDGGRECVKSAKK